MGMERLGVRFSEEGNEWRLPNLLKVNDLALCGELEVNLRVIIGHFGQVGRSRSLKGNTNRRDKSKVIVFGWKQGSVGEVSADGRHLKHVLEFKYLKFVLDKSGTN